MVGRKEILHWLGIDSPTSRILLVLKLAVFLDMVGVGLYVPLLPFYWRELGVKTELLGLVASVYQISQIVSGVVLGYVSDHLSGRKNILLLSFLGSAVSYTLAGLSYQNSLISTLVLSRFIVGLVKQTMTISRAITTSLTSDEDRTRSLSHLRACATLAFLVGPTMGGLLSKTFNKAVPAYAAAALFVLNALMVQLVLPNDISQHAHSKEKTVETEEEKKKKEEKEKQEADKPKVLVRSNSTGAIQGIKDLMEKEGLGSLTLIKFLNSVFVAACHVFSSKYVTEKYELEPHHMGYLSSYQSLVSLASQTYLVAAISKRFGEERTLQAAFLVSCAVSVLEGFSQHIFIYAALIPIRTLSGDLISQMFETLFTSIVPKSEAASAFGTLGLLKAIARVGGPLYGGLLFAHVGTRLGFHARPAVESIHNFFILAMLLWAYPILHKANKQKLA